MNATTVNEYAAALHRLATDGTPQATVLAQVDAIVASLFQSGRRGDAKRLLHLLEALTDDGQPVTQVVAAAPLSAAAQARFGSDARALTDRSLVAGARVRKGDRLIRSSLRDRMDTLLQAPFH